MPGRPWRGLLEPFEAAILALAAAIVVYQVLIPPPVGLADDGDFGKIMGQVGLKYPTRDFDAKFYGFLTLRYDVVDPWWKSEYRTSELPLAALARQAALAFDSRRMMDIRVLGSIHALLFLGALALLLVGSRGWPARSRLSFAALLVFFFTDVGYVGLFNSLYSAAASYLFLTLTAAAALLLARGAGSGAIWGAYWIGAALFVTSKPNESLEALPLAALGVALVAANPDRRRRIASAALAAVLVAAGVAYYFSTPAYLKTEALYNDVFLQILSRSPDRKADLAELSLPAAWEAYAGTHAYVPDVPLKKPAFRAEFRKRVQYRTILKFYLRHPDRLRRLFRSAAQNAFRLRQHYLGNLPSDAGGKPRQWSRAFGVWSAVKAKIGPAGPVLLPIFWLANLAAASWLARRGRPIESRLLASSVGVLTGMSILEFLVCSLADALADVARHLHSFNAMTDLLLVADLVFLVSGGAVLGTRLEAVPAAAGDGRPGSGPARAEEVPAVSA